MNEFTSPQPDTERPEDTTDARSKPAPLAPWRRVLYLVIIGTSALVTADVIRNYLRHGEDLVPWRESIEVGHPEAIDRGMPMLVQFSTEHCGACEAMTGLVFSQPVVADTIDAHFVPVKVDMYVPGQATTRLIKAADVRGYPTLVLVSTSGEPYARMDGFHEADEVLDWLDRHATAPQSVSTLDH